MRCVEWRDDGLWRLLCSALSLVWTPRLPRVFELREEGWVGQVSGSSPDGVKDRWCLSSIRLNRLQPRASTSSARLWRLTFEWATSQPAPPIPPSGPLSASRPNGSDSGGGDGSIRPTGTTSTSGGACDPVTVERQAAAEIGDSHGGRARRAPREPIRSIWHPPRSGALGRPRNHLERRYEPPRGTCWEAQPFKESSPPLTTAKRI